MGIPFLWAECKSYLRPDIMAGEHQLFLESLFYASFIAALVAPNPIPALYSIFFYGDRCDFYKIKVNDVRCIAFLKYLLFEDGRISVLSTFWGVIATGMGEKGSVKGAPLFYKCCASLRESVACGE